MTMTVGKKACGITFNPSERKDVADIKLAAANLIDTIITSMSSENIASQSLADELLKAAIVKILEAQSNAVRILFLDDSLKG